MKIECKCGNLVIDSEATQIYHWMKTSDWWRLRTFVDDEIEAIDENTNKEEVIMKIRYEGKACPVWECSDCERLITLKDGDVVFFTRE